MDRLLRIGLVPLKEMLTPASSLALLLPHMQPVYINNRQPECTPRWQPPPCQEESPGQDLHLRFSNQQIGRKCISFVQDTQSMGFCYEAKLPKLTFLKSLWGSKTFDPSTSVSKHCVWPRLLVITSLENFFAHLGLPASFLTQSIQESKLIQIHHYLRQIQVLYHHPLHSSWPFKLWVKF